MLDIRLPTEFPTGALTGEVPKGTKTEVQRQGLPERNCPLFCGKGRKVIQYW